MNRNTLLILTLAALAAPALAQTPADTGGGHAHDANQQVGSGGVNQEAGQIDYRLRNDVVTGNVTGSAGFRGGVGYTAPGEFRGTLGSDTTFDFRARSLPPAGAPSAPGAVYQPYTGGGAGASVYRDYTNLAGQSFIQGPTAPTYLDGGNRLVVPVETPTATGLYDTGRFGGPITATGVVVGTYTESQILGVRPTRGPLDANIAAPGPAEATTTDQTPQTPTAEEQAEDDAADAALNRQSRVDYLQQPQMPATGFEAVPSTADGVQTATTPGDSTTGDADADASGARMLKPTLAIGRRLEPDRVSDARDAQLARQLTNELFSESAVQPGQSIYNDLIQSVRAGDEKGAATDTPTADLPQPEDQAVRKAEAEALAAIRAAYGLEPEEPAAGAATGDAQDAEGAADEDPDLQKLMDQLNYNLPAISTMAGQETSRANELIRQAEAAMTAGDYFKAETLYKQAVMFNPKDPMSSVGVVHAQLGAGLFRSAALSLRRLYEQHPELIAARYEPRLLPSAERLRWVQSELNKLAENAESNTEAGLLMAYVGYQTNSRQLLRYGMALAQARSPRDPLLPVLRQIWLDEGSLDEADDATTPQK